VIDIELPNLAPANTLNPEPNLTQARIDMVDDVV
jgi:hypothetical protein